MKSPITIIILGLAMGARILAAQNFAPTGLMNEPRRNHAAVALNNGTVLVTGGYPSTGGTAEIYDPSVGTWRYTSHPMRQPREAHSMAKLADGRVLVVGGSAPGSGPSLQSAEVFDPVTEQFTAVQTPRYAHGVRQPAILLNDGRVLVVGGDLGSETYDPAHDIWTPTPPIPVGDREATAVKLADGMVLAMGGDVANPGCCVVSSVYKYIPESNTVTQMESMRVPRVMHTATLLPNGQIVIAAGSDEFSSFDSTEIYDPTSLPNGLSQFGTALNQARQQHRAVLLPNGDLFVIGGVLGGTPPIFYSTGELRDHNTGLWSIAGTASTPRYLNTATLLPSGAVLVAGGGPGIPTNTAEILDKHNTTDDRHHSRNYHFSCGNIYGHRAFHVRWRRPVVHATKRTGRDVHNNIRCTCRLHNSRIANTELRCWRHYNLHGHIHKPAQNDCLPTNSVLFISAGGGWPDPAADY